MLVIDVLLHETNLTLITAIRLTWAPEATCEWERLLMTEIRRVCKYWKYAKWIFPSWLFEHMVFLTVNNGCLVVVHVGYLGQSVVGFVMHWNIREHTAATGVLWLFNLEWKSKSIFNCRKCFHSKIIFFLDKCSVYRIGILHQLRWIFHFDLIWLPGSTCRLPT